MPAVGGGGEAPDRDYPEADEQADQESHQVDPQVARPRTGGVARRRRGAGSGVSSGVGTTDSVGVGLGATGCPVTLTRTCS